MCAEDKGAAVRRADAFEQLAGTGTQGTGLILVAEQTACPGELTQAARGLADGADPLSGRDAALEHPSRGAGGAEVEQGRPKR